MNTNPKKAKLFIALAISLIALLLIISIGQIIGIARQTKKNQKLEQEITRLENLVNYHENQQSADKDDKEISKEINDNNEHDLGGEQ